MSELKINLTKKIDTSDLFIVLGTRNYVDALKGTDESIMIQIATARELKKPFFVIIDRNLSQEDRKYLDEYFSKDNIISRMEVDIYNRSSITYIVKEMKKLLRELNTESENDSGITIVSPYDDDNGYGLL